MSEPTGVVSGTRRGLLLLVHRIPYPPDKGDKIRSYHLLRFLAARFDVYLGAFVDDESDFVHREVLEALCKEVFLVGLRPTSKRLRSLSGLLTNEPLSMPYYRDPAMRRWVASKRSEGAFDAAVTFSSTMAQYTDAVGLPTIADIVDLDSEKWHEYAQRKPWPLSWIYQREGRTLRSVEEQIIVGQEAALLISDNERSLLSDDLAKRVTVVGNGVDTEFFSPAVHFENPFPAQERAIVFTGAMDYFANADAVTWFATNVFPHVLNKVDNATFYIVGSRPSEAVMRLQAADRVNVTGRVEDVRPYLRYAHAVVAPLQVARGIQNKVLEALSMEKAVVATRAAMEGISHDDARVATIADEPQQFAEQVIDFAARDTVLVNRHGRRFVEEHFSWEAHLSGLLPILERLGFAHALSEPHTAGAKQVAI